MLRGMCKRGGYIGRKNDDGNSLHQHKRRCKRGGGDALGFEEALLTGLARDGGLYLPHAYPRFAAGELDAMAAMPYAEVAARIMAKFTGADMDFDALLRLCQDAYAGFSAPEITPPKTHQ